MTHARATINDKITTLFVLLMELTVKRQVEETVALHQGISARAACIRMKSLLIIKTRLHNFYLASKNDDPITRLIEFRCLMIRDFKNNNNDSCLNREIYIAINESFKLDLRFDQQKEKTFPSCI